MTEEQTRSLIQGSLVKTSDDFTEKLMSRVEAQKAKRMRVHFLLAFIASFALLFLVTKLTPEINWYHFHLKSHPGAIHILGVLLTFVLLNKLISLKRELSKPASLQ